MILKTHELIRKAYNKSANYFTQGRCSTWWYPNLNHYTNKAINGTNTKYLGSTQLLDIGCIRLVWSTLSKRKILGESILNWESITRFISLLEKLHDQIIFPGRWYFRKKLKVFVCSQIKFLLLPGISSTHEIFRLRSFKHFSHQETTGCVLSIACFKSWS